MASTLQSQNNGYRVIYNPPLVTVTPTHYGHTFVLDFKLNVICYVDGKALGS